MFDVIIEGSSRNTDCALRWASEYGHTEVVGLLLEKGADVHANDDEALRLASRNGRTEVVVVLEAWMRRGVAGDSKRQRTS